MDSTILTAQRKTFGARVKTLRKQQNLSQEKLGEHADLHRAYIGAVERGEQNISINNITKIAHALGVKIHDLFKP